VKDLFSIFLDQVIFRPLAESLRDAGGGGGLLGGLFTAVGSLFGGARANGGPVSAGKAYLVGERGPELLVPRNAGTIIPNQRLAAPTAGGMKQEIYVDARGAVMNDRFASEILRQAKGFAAEAGSRAYRQAMKDAPGAVSYSQRYGPR